MSALKSLFYIHHKYLRSLKMCSQKVQLLTANSLNFNNIVCQQSFGNSSHYPVSSPAFTSIYKGSSVPHSRYCTDRVRVTTLMVMFLFESQFSDCAWSCTRIAFRLILFFTKIFIFHSISSPVVYLFPV